MRTWGLIGYPLGHSFSRKFFTDKFARENLDEQYLNFELEHISLLPSVIGEHPDLAGLNVTIPYKEQVIAFCDRLDPVATETGAVNTIRISRQNKLLLLEGYNTDVHGFSESLSPLLKPGMKSALILGTGGAAKAVKYALDKLGINWLQISRNPSPGKAIRYEQITPSLMKDYLLIINTTPLGTFPDTGSFPDIPYEWLTPYHLLYDLVYNPPETLFLQKGRERGAMTKNGLEMLELQALKSYEIWNEK